MLRARKAPPATAPDGAAVDLGLVGEVMAVDPRPIRTVQDAGYIPVVAPTASDEGGATYNINADVVAGDIAAALRAEKLVLLTDTDGILDRQGRLLSTLARSEVERLIGDGTITRGMLPKVRACFNGARRRGAQDPHRETGPDRTPSSRKLLTPDGVGTEIIA